MTVVSLELCLLFSSARSLAKLHSCFQVSGIDLISDLYATLDFKWQIKAIVDKLTLL